MTTYRRVGDVLWRRSLGRFIGRRHHGQSIVVGGAGAALWDVLGSPASLAEVATRLAETFDVDPVVVASEVEPVLALLVEHGLVATDP